jgi:hypothetical protein
LELATWSAQHDSQTGDPQDWLVLVNAEKEEMIRLIRATVQRGGSIFVGADSVVNQLAIR